jgi:drug/metabolite transporter (DMT)-like permease
MTRSVPRQGRSSASAFSRRTAFILLALVILIWGVNWPVMKIGLETLPPFTFAAARIVLGALTLFAVLAVTGGVRLPPRHDLPVVLSVGLGQIAAFLGFVNLGLQYVPAGRSAILSYTTPIWVVPAAVLILHEHMGWRTALGLGLGLFGIAALFNPWGFDWSNREALIGNAYLLLAALAWAASLIHVKMHRWESSPFELTPWQLVVAAIPLVALAVLFEPVTRLSLDRTTVFVLAFNGPISTAFAVWAWLSVNRALPAITSSLGSLGVPVVGLIASVAVLGETVDAATVAGLAAIVGGLVLVSLDAPQPTAAVGKNP